MENHGMYVGANVSMAYRGRELLGRVVEVCSPGGRRYDYLYVESFNGEPWPVQPLAWEVRGLDVTYPEVSGDE